MVASGHSGQAARVLQLPTSNFQGTTAILFIRGSFRSLRYLSDKTIQFVLELNVLASAFTSEGMLVLDSAMYLDIPGSSVWCELHDLQRLVDRSHDKHSANHFDTRVIRDQMV